MDPRQLSRIFAKGVRVCITHAHPRVSFGGICADCKPVDLDVDSYELASVPRRASVTWLHIRHAQYGAEPFSVQQILLLPSHNSTLHVVEALGPVLIHARDQAVRVSMLLLR